MRDAAIAIIREIGVDTGGSNIQFAVHPRTGRLMVIEMNPRVSRSSALASKATGFPIAKIAAKLAVGYTLDELRNDITRETPACFEPTIDYVVTKIPRFTFEKFPQAERHARPADEVGRRGDGDRPDVQGVAAEGDALARDRQPRLRAARSRPSDDELERPAARARTPTACGTSGEAFRRGLDRRARRGGRPRIDPWFLRQIEEIVAEERVARRRDAGRARSGAARAGSSRMGFSDVRLAALLGTGEDGGARAARGRRASRPSSRRSTPAAPSSRPSRRTSTPPTSRATTRRGPPTRRKIVILGGGPNRIGQGIEFDYCCVHAAFALREDGFETIMVNCNPETVSTDYDTSDKLYFEPLTLEDVLALHRAARGPTGSSSSSAARRRCGSRCRSSAPACRSSARRRTRSTAPRTASASSEVLTDARPAAAAERRRAQRRGGRARSPTSIGYPVLVRPSYVLGGRAMEIVYDRASLGRYMRHAVRASPEHPVLIDQFLEDAIEVDVDAVSDGTRRRDRRHHGAHRARRRALRRQRLLAAAVLDRRRGAGGDPAPDRRAGARARRRRPHERAVRRARTGVVYVLEVNPRASRTVPFVSQGDRRAARQDRGALHGRDARSPTRASPARSSRRT